MRDTDLDWQKIAETTPYFGVFTKPEYVNPTPEALRELFKSGEVDIAHYLSMLRHVFGVFEPKSALDFGCGVGRLTIPLAKAAGRATGIDVADGMIALARKHCAEARVAVEFYKSIPADQKFDWVNSHIVLQHIPPARGYDILGDLWRCVAPGGAFNVHVTIYRDARHQGELTRELRVCRFDGDTAVNYGQSDWESQQISMYDYDLSRVLSCLDGNDALYMERVDHGGCHGVRIYARKK